MALDRIILGDNQFFGINHMSESKAQQQTERFREIDSILDIVDTAWENGVHAFMFTPHDKVPRLCDHFRARAARYSDLRLYPALPYAHKYANAVNEKGMIGALSLSGPSIRLTPERIAQMKPTLMQAGAAICRALRSPFYDALGGPVAAPR